MYLGCAPQGAIDISPMYGFFRLFCLPALLPKSVCSVQICPLTTPLRLQWQKCQPAGLEEASRNSINILAPGTDPVMCIVPSRWWSNPCQHATPSARRTPVTPVWLNMHICISFYSRTRSLCAQIHPDESSARHPGLRSCHSKKQKSAGSPCPRISQPCKSLLPFGPSILEDTGPTFQKPFSSTP